MPEVPEVPEPGWTAIDTCVLTPAANTIYSRDVTNSTKYTYYRIKINFSTTAQVGLREVEMHSGTEAELVVRDEAGKVTTLSPHNFSLRSRR